MAKDTAPDKMRPMCIIPDFAGDKELISAFFFDEVLESLANSGFISIEGSTVYLPVALC